MASNFCGFVLVILVCIYLHIYNTSQKKCTVITIRTSVFTERIVGSNVKMVQYQITVKPY